MTLERPDVQDFIIVGATGDLSRRKLLPSLYNLHVASMLPRQFTIIGFARTPLDDAAFRKLAHDSVEEFSRTGLDPEVWQDFERRLAYVRMSPEGYGELVESCTAANRIFYISTPPDAVPAIIHSIKQHGLAEGARVVIEKPFGNDIESAKELDNMLHEAFDESQVFRIDHYLGKETVQNLLSFRFVNSLFERVWNRDAVEHIQVTVAESIGIEGRGTFYEEVGALRDIVQNHVLQMLALLTMEPPTSFDPEQIRDEKIKLLRAVRPIDPRRVVRAQYTPGFIDGEAVPGYKQEPNVAPNSTTETYVALELFIDNWRWAGVPFYLRTGKRLPSRDTEVQIAFRPTPIDYLPGGHAPASNHLIYRIQPDEGISLQILAKAPGPKLNVKPIDLEFSYSDGFMVEPSEAYERLLHDVMQGDQTLFVRQDAIERAWEIVQPVLDHPSPVHLYEAGSWGPNEADDLLSPNKWHLG